MQPSPPPPAPPPTAPPPPPTTRDQQRARGRPLLPYRKPDSAPPYSSSDAALLRSEIESLRERLEQQNAAHQADLKALRAQIHFQEQQFQHAMHAIRGKFEQEHAKFREEVDNALRVAAAAAAAPAAAAPAPPSQPPSHSSHSHHHEQQQRAHPHLSQLSDAVHEIEQEVDRLTNDTMHQQRQDDVELMRAHGWDDFELERARQTCEFLRSSGLHGTQVACPLCHYQPGARVPMSPTHGFG